MMINKLSSKLDIAYEDNHIIVVNKRANLPVQLDSSQDECLLDEVKAFIKIRDKKPGNVFLGLIHRIDRPTSGLVILAKTSKALSKFSELFRSSKVEKTYMAILDSIILPEEGRLEDKLKKNAKLNKSFVSKDGKDSILDYKYIQKGKTFFLAHIKLITGRHHQIRAQFANKGVHIKGDLKYGAKRSNKEDEGISLHSYSLKFIHPISQKEIFIVSKLPKGFQIFHLSSLPTSF